MKNKIKSTIKKSLINFPGWRTNRKIVVIESDDWGMVRMPSKEVYKTLIKKGYSVDQCPYNRNDALESNQDLENLFEVLHSVKDKNGNSAVLTANVVVANPDFEKIRDSGYREYHYEPFTETLNRYPEHDRVYELYREGINDKIFYPQFHAREHLNVNRWMEKLNEQDKKLLDAFQFNMFTVHLRGRLNGRRDNLDAFGGSGKSNFVRESDIIETGLSLFESLFGYRSKSFIAPCYVWSNETEEILFEQGVEYIQGTHVQRVPAGDRSTDINKRYHYLGQHNKHGQVYLVRNVFFEPTEKPEGDSVLSALNDINNAFLFRKPAIVSSHRVNYMGGVHAENRTKNLELLKKLLSKIVEKYPDVEFMTSEQLGDLIINKH